MTLTSTIDITNVKKILSSCPNYDDIVNYEYKEGDILSSMLIDWYRELIFSVNASDEKALKIIREIDRSLSIYVKNNSYKKGLKEVLKESDISLQDINLIKLVIKKIIEFTNKFERDLVLSNVLPRWI